MKINFNAIELRLKSLIEGSSQIIASQRTQPAFHVQLANSLKHFLKEENINDLEDFPESLLLEVAPASLADWENFPVGETIQALLLDAGLSGNFAPKVNISVNEELLTGESILRNAAQKTIQIDRTAAMPAISRDEDLIAGETIPPLAFVIVNGLDTRMLTKQVINIGRRLENDLVIEDPRVSREHAQIRAVKGHYVVLDLNSSGGTFVNSVRVSQQILRPGDVISLAGLPLVYGEDTTPPISQTGRVTPAKDQKSHGDHS